MVLTVSFVLSPVIGLSCHRHLARLLAKLDAGFEASGPHDFAVRPRSKTRVAETSAIRGTAGQTSQTPSTSLLPPSVSRTVRFLTSSGFEDVARPDRSRFRNRRKVGKQLRMILHDLQDVFRLDMRVDIKGRLQDAEPGKPVFRTEQRTIIVRRQPSIRLLDI